MQDKKCDWPLRTRLKVGSASARLSDRKRDFSVLPLARAFRLSRAKCLKQSLHLMEARPGTHDIFLALVSAPALPANISHIGLHSQACCNLRMEPLEHCNIYCSNASQAVTLPSPAHQSLSAACRSCAAAPCSHQRYAGQRSPTNQTLSFQKETADSRQLTDSITHQHLAFSGQLHGPICLCGKGCCDVIYTGEASCNILLCCCKLLLKNVLLHSPLQWISLCESMLSGQSVFTTNIDRPLLSGSEHRSGGSSRSPTSDSPADVHGGHSKLR